MCLHARVLTRILRLLACTCLVTGALLSKVTATAKAAEAVAGIPLPPGERVLDLAWTAERQVILLVSTKDGYALRKLELQSAELTVIAVPKSFAQLKPADGATGPIIWLSPMGNGLAVLERTTDPLASAELSLYRLEDSGLVAVSDRARPADFYPAQLAWSSDGRELYLACEPYLMPEQPYSLACINLDNGSYKGLVLKSNLDLVDELVAIPQRNQLAVRCQSIRGEYPQHKLVVLVELGKPGMEILHSQADEMHLKPLGNGQVLLCSSCSSSQPQGQENTLAVRAGDSWMLLDNSPVLQPVSLAPFADIASLNASSNGEWLGFLAAPEDLGIEGEAGTQYLGFQNTQDARVLATAIPCALYRFAPAGDMVCAVDGSDRIYFYQLPQTLN